MHLFPTLMLLLIAITVADTNTVRQLSQGPQSPNYFNCQNVTTNYSRDPQDLKIIKQLLNTVQHKDMEISNLREERDRLICRLQTRSNRDNDTVAREAAAALEKQGISGGAKVDSLLKPSYDKVLEEYTKGNEKQQQKKNQLAELAFERASALKIQFKFKEAMEFYEKAVHLNSNNIDYQIGLAKNYYWLGDPFSALSILKNSEPLALISEPITRSKFYYSLGWLYQSIGKTDTAFYYLHPKGIDSILSGKKDSSIAENYNNLGFAWYLKEDFNKAIDYLSRALAIDTVIYKKSTSTIANIYCGLAASWGARGDDDKAIDFFSRALSIDTLICDKKNPDIADIYCGLAEALDSKGDHDKAIGYFCQALDIDTVAFGNKHCYLAKIFGALGYAWYSKGVPDTAVIFYSRAIAIDTNVFGKSHPDVARYFNALGMAWNLKGEYDKAITSFETGIEYGLKYWNKEYSEIKEMQNNLESAKKKKLSK